MLGSIIGDIVGSKYEFHNIKTKEFDLFSKGCKFTDDTVMTCAVAKSIMDYRKTGNKGNLFKITVDNMQLYGCEFPHRGYGTMFGGWIHDDDPKPYQSWGNGAAMRISPCALAARSLEEAEELATIITNTTHNTEMALKWTLKLVKLIYLLRNERCTIKDAIDQIDPDNAFGCFTLDEIRDSYAFDVSCQGTVVPAVRAFIESTSFVDAIRNAISIGGDSDTLAAITGSIAEVYHNIDVGIGHHALDMLDDYRCPQSKRMLRNVVLEFYETMNVLGRRPIRSDDGGWRICSALICHHYGDI